MSEEWRENLLLDGKGAVDKRVSSNFVTMLRMHPDMVGVFGKRGEDRMVLRAPPWAPRDGGWQPRMLEHMDHLQTQIWLQTQGLRPLINETKSAVRFVCEENPI